MQNLDKFDVKEYRAFCQNTMQM